MTTILIASPRDPVQTTRRDPVWKPRRDAARQRVNHIRPLDKPFVIEFCKWAIIEAESGLLTSGATICATFVSETAQN